jgi:hypothetical protein
MSRETAARLRANGAAGQPLTALPSSPQPSLLALPAWLTPSRELAFFRGCLHAAIVVDVSSSCLYLLLPAGTVVFFGGVPTPSATFWLLAVAMRAKCDPFHLPARDGLTLLATMAGAGHTWLVPAPFIRQCYGFSGAQEPIGPLSRTTTASDVRRGSCNIELRYIGSTSPNLSLYRRRLVRSSLQVILSRTKTS